jgi:ribA/ribD-fused uncharacterized protein
LKGAVEMINSFRGNYYFLSNMYPCPVVYEGMEFKCAEAAFQAAKTLNLEMRKRFTQMDGFEAKRFGRSVKLRDDWDKVRLPVMSWVLLDKFTRNADLKEKLLMTGDMPLIEGNNWNDRFWGVCNGVGDNNLGKLLMRLRKHLSKG